MRDPVNREIRKTHEQRLEQVTRMAGVFRVVRVCLPICPPKAWRRRKHRAGRWFAVDSFLCVLCVSVVQFGAVTVFERDLPQRRRVHREDLNPQKDAKTRKDPDPAPPCPLRSFAIFC